jgi:thiamine biosynthesis lipoprotein
MIKSNLSFFLIAFVLSSSVAADWYSYEEDIMGTKVSVELWEADESAANTAGNAVMAEMRRIDALMSPYIETSELYRVNARASIAPVKVSSELLKVIEKAQFYSRLSGGAFDVSFSSVGQFYDYRAGSKPDQQQLKASLPAVNYKSIRLDRNNSTVTFLKPGMNIDLGGIAKGYAVDLAIDKLTELGVESAIVTAGGDSRILGDRRGTPWMMGIRHPRKKGEFAIKIPLENTAISTSGDYERFFMEGDKRIHHILNPDTGKPAKHIQSVTVITPRAIDSDALSTTVFVLGVEKGLKLINRLDGVDAMIISANGRLHYSDDLLMPVTD